MDKGGSNPAPNNVDPVQLANAQADANIKAAQATAGLNRVNQYGPTGSITWTQGPDGKWVQNTALNPQQQGLLDQSYGLANGALQNQINNPIQLQGPATAPQMGKIGNQDLPSFANVTNYGVPVSALNVNGVQNIPKADQQAYNQAVNSVYGQAASRLDPQFAQQQKRLETQLTDQGIPQNSVAWNKAMDEFSRNKNDAYTSAFNNAVTQGNQVENTQFGMGLQANQAGIANALTQGSFANQAAQQDLAQQLSAAGFNNQTSQQGLQNLIAQHGFDNQALQQMWQNQNANAQLNNANSMQQMQQNMALAGLPNQFSSVSLPGIAGAQVNPTDVIGAQSLSSQQQLAVYQAKLQQQEAKKQGTGSTVGMLGAAAIMSDARVKRDIRRVGRLRNGLNVYSYRYVGQKRRELGLLAQEVERIRPDAVISFGGIKHVIYQKAVAA